jgi:hypothetical protein
MSVRYNSTAPRKTPEELAKKAALKERDAIQKDWDARILSYEELLPKTQNPTAVRMSVQPISLLELTSCLQSLAGRFPH